MKDQINTMARIAGALYLINIVFGFFAIGYMPMSLVVSGDAVATGQNIVAHLTMYRLALVAHIIILLTNIPLAVIFYQLFKVVNKNGALLVVFTTLVGTAVEASNLLNQLAPMSLLSGAGYLSAFTPQQLQALAYMLFHLHDTGFNLAVIFFGCYGITAGYLIFRSGFLPRLIGVGLSVGGLCYIVHSFSMFLAPAFAAKLVPYIQIPSGLSELAFCLWLLIAGVNGKKWTDRVIPI